MESRFGSYPFDEQTVQKIIQILNKHPQSKRIVFQYPKTLLTESLNLTRHLRKVYFQVDINKQQNERRQFYTLFDSMKKQCCTDIIGAQHVNYQLLIHFGEACFSQSVQKNHHYLLPTITKQQQQHLKDILTSPKFTQELKTNRIKYLLTEQKLYGYVKQVQGVQVMRLKCDSREDDQYVIFGYYAKRRNSAQQSKQESKELIQQNNNILVLLAEHPQADNKLLSDIHLTLGSFSSNRKLFTQSPQIFVCSLQVPSMSKSNVNYSKSLMMRLSQIGQLYKYDTFGLLVSNVGTSFCRQMIEKCQYILQKQDKKYFVFMMNNLNEVKLGNFPQVQVYVVISCFNNSCFGMKDFCRLVVTPMDLQVAFNDVSINQYNFDLSHPATQSVQQQESTSKSDLQQVTTKQQQHLHLSVQQKQQIILRNTFQTLEYYRGKQYKGLDSSQKKQVEKIKKGKIGLAQQYEPLPQDQNK